MLIQSTGRKRIIPIIVLLAFTTSCGGKTSPQPELTNSVTASPFDEALSPVEINTEPLVVCFAQAPTTLYPYGSLNQAARWVLQAVYDDPVDLVSYGYQAGVLAELPSLDNGAAQLKVVDVQLGQIVLAEDGQPHPLAAGLRLRPAGCRSDECAIVFSGGTLQMEQLTVDFQLRSGLTWADGTPVSIQDSIYAFQVNADPGTPASRYKNDRTASYQAIDETTLQWVGIPGFLDPDYQSYFWTPLPQHLLGSANPAQMVNNESAAKTPLGYGPFTVTSWEGDTITLMKNPFYTPAPLMDQMIIKVIGDEPNANLNKIQQGECDLLSPDAVTGIEQESVMSSQNRGEVQLAWADSNGWEGLFIGIHPYSYDVDGYNQMSGDRPAYFNQVQTRWAIAMCLDREQVAQQIVFGSPAVMDTFLPPIHPLYNSSAALYAYDLTAASTLFVQAGWSEYSGGPRRALAVSDIFGSLPFEITYHHLDDPASTAIAQALAQHLAACGVQATLIPSGADELFADGQKGALFGRNFDLAQFSWQTAVQPSCQLFLSEAIPGEDIDQFPYGWGGTNISGWRNNEYDTACKAAMGALPGEPNYIQMHQLTQAIFANELPVIPLFTHQQLVAARPDLCGLAFDATAGLLWNVEELAFGEYCPAP